MAARVSISAYKLIRAMCHTDVSVRHLAAAIKCPVSDVLIMVKSGVPEEYAARVEDFIHKNGGKI